MDVSHLLDALNPAQREAVSAPPGHYLVLAGAGSGKTRVLVHRIAWLTEVLGVPSWGVLAVTFTNKAAGEMRLRCEQSVVGGTRGPHSTGSGQASTGLRTGMWIGTFHGLAHRLLRLHWQEAALPQGFQVLDSDDQLRLVKRVIADLGIDDSRTPPRQAAWFINSCKDEGKRPEHIQGGRAEQDLLLRVYAAYDAVCRRAGLVDFAELLLRAHELLRDHAGLLAHYRQRFRPPAGRRIPGHQPSSTASCACLAGDSARCSWSATTTRRSTAGAAPRSRTCSISCATSPRPRRSSWSRTTVPPTTSCRPRTR
jgi:DNA helicase-2/ATP-dependent DNA helicase PcrA